MAPKLIKLTISAAITLASLTCAASYKVFEAPMEESDWQFNGNPLTCNLSHSIPLYGKAEFHKIAGSQEKLGFKLGYKRHKISADKVADVRALSPSWHPLQASRELGQAEIKNGKHIITSEETATWRLLNELEIGRFPTFFYQDFNSVEDQVSVALSAVGFKKEYGKFLDCLANLVPYKIDQLSKMTLYFDFDKASIRGAYKNRLTALAQYVKYDPSVEVVLIRGYTDSKGSRAYNQKLSQSRIDSVKNILQLDGVSDERFKTQAFGENSPAATNRTASGRAKNRRVYIRIAQN